MLMNDKIIFDSYCCINSANHCENEEIIGALNLYPHHIFLREYAFKAVHDLGPVQIIIILHVLCMAPGNKDK